MPYATNSSLNIGVFNFFFFFFFDNVLENMGKYDDLSIMYKKSIKVADLLQLQRLHATSLLLESAKNVDVFKCFAR